MAIRMPAGPAWVLNLAWFRSKKIMQITKLLFWMWVAYVSFGVRMTVAHWGSEDPVKFFWSFYFTMYAVMGFLWHYRELYLGSKWAAAPADTDLSVSNSQSNPGSASPAGTQGQVRPAEPAAGAAIVPAAPAGRHRAGGWDAQPVAKVLLRMGIIYIVFCASQLSSVSEGDRLLWLFALMYAIAVLISLTRETELGRYRHAGGNVPQREPMPASAANAAAAGYSIPGRVLSLQIFGYAGATMLTKLIFWLHFACILITLAMTFAYWKLPGKQWYYTAQAVLYAIQGFVMYAHEIFLWQGRGDGYY